MVLRRDGEIAALARHRRLGVSAFVSSTFSFQLQALFFWLIEFLVQGTTERNAPLQYQAEVIIVREKPLLLSDIASEEDESVKDEA